MLLAIMLSVANKPIMSVIMLNIVMLSVVKLNVVKLSVIKLNVVRLSVVAPYKQTVAQKIMTSETVDVS